MKGVQLSPEFDIDQTKQVLSGLVEDIDSAVLVPNSFEIFIERNHLKFQV